LADQEAETLATSAKKVSAANKRTPVSAPKVSFPFFRSNAGRLLAMTDVAASSSRHGPAGMAEFSGLGRIWVSDVATSSLRHGPAGMADFSGFGRTWDSVMPVYAT
jgi:hypothetical protein